ncbi:MAG: hypothetical protein HY835_03500, partial [Anaerolineae bacterium]|nr:hypothetical protein [Anaerolineae bacterium]
MHSSIEKLTKFFRLERELKFSNRAIVGGLDKIIPNWEQEARQNRLEPHLIDKTIEVLQSYPGMPVEEREAALDGLIDYLVANERSKPPQTANSEAPAAKEAMPVNKESAHEGILPEAPLDRLPSKVETRPNEFIDEPRPPRPVVRSTNNRSQVALSAPLTAVSGIGEKHAQTLERLGLYTINDLLYYFPRRYDDYSRLKPINRLEYGEQVTVLGTIQAIQSRPVRGGAAQLVEAVLSDGTGTLRLSWFNRSYLMTKFRPGMQVVLAGKIDLYLGRLVMSNPDIEELEKEQINTNRIVPVYGLTNGITQRWLRNIIHGVVTFWAPRVDDYLPASVRSAMKVVDLGVALLQTHFPDSQDSLDLARWRLAFDEIFLMQMGVMQQKRTWETASGRVFETPDEWLSEQTNLLPYQLTNAQSRALQEIRQDLSSGRPMDRL